MCKNINHNNQPKVAVFNDFSGFGRCSIAVALPLISALKVQCCAIPTAIFSNHTGFESFFVDDYTEKIENYTQEWGKLGLEFNAISSGFLGSTAQISIVENFISRFKTPKTLVIIDPVMGDVGRLYPTYKPETAQKMRSLVTHADILTPNLTEACILTDTPYTPNPSDNFLRELCFKLNRFGAKKIVITGLDNGCEISNMIFDHEKGFSFVSKPKSGKQRSGTGDVFSAIITGCAVRKFDFTKSVEIAAEFISKAIKRSDELKIPTTDGICFEEILNDLTSL